MTYEAVCWPLNTTCGTDMRGSMLTVNDHMCGTDMWRSMLTVNDHMCGTDIQGRVVVDY